MADRSSSRVELRVFPDYCADPVWQTEGMVNLDDLAIPRRLRDELRAWARDWEVMMGVRESRYAVVDDGAHADWHARGEALAGGLQRELGDRFDVRYEA